ncbi:MAG: hypothetical protein JXR44_07490, partial [Thiotrichales bacterium]|nr:hypothetical protein [Thiotrichales bacterium]
MKTPYSLGLALGTAMLLSGCDLDLLSSSSSNSDNNNEPPPAEQTADLNGTAAVGAPIVGGQVTAKCSDGSGFTTGVTTNANGTWSGQVGLGALPCALSVNDSNRNIVLKSFTASP